MAVLSLNRVYVFKGKLPKVGIFSATQFPSLGIFTNKQARKGFRTICARSTLGDFRNISTISIFLLAVAPYNFYNFDTKMM